MFRIRRWCTQMLQRTACRVWTDGIVLLQPCCTPVARNNCATSMQIGESLHCIENVDHSCAGSCDDLNRIVPSIVFSINCGEQRVCLRDVLRRCLRTNVRNIERCLASAFPEEVRAAGCARCGMSCMESGGCGMEGSTGTTGVPAALRRYWNSWCVR